MDPHFCTQFHDLYKYAKSWMLPPLFNIAKIVFGKVAGLLRDECMYWSRKLGLGDRGKTWVHGC
jgi:hypothetical protein